MTPARISLALALLPHAGYTDPATAAQVRELLLAALGDHPLDAVAFPDVSAATAFELVNNVVIELLAETVDVLFTATPAPSATMLTHECVAAYGIDGELLAVSTTDTGLAAEIRKQGYDLAGCIRVGEMSVHRVALQVPALLVPGTAVVR